MALDGRCLLALAFLRGLFVELAAPKLGEDAGLLAGALEAPQGGIEVLVLTHADARHRNLKSLTGKEIFGRQLQRGAPEPVGGGGFYGSAGEKAKGVARVSLPL